MVDSKQLNLVVITPEQQVLEETAEAVVIPAHDGELGVLRDRAALVCELGTGQLRYTQAGQTNRLFIDGGFAQVLDNQVTVLTPEAVPAENVTLDMVHAAQRTADEHSGHTPEERAAHEHAQRRWNVLRRLLRAG